MDNSALNDSMIFHRVELFVGRGESVSVINKDCSVRVLKCARC